MPELISLGAFNAKSRGAYSLDRKPWVALAIAPTSLVDAVTVAGIGTLRAGQVLPVRCGAPITVEPLRSFRHGTGYTPASETTEVNNRCDLIAWQQGEQGSIVAQARAPWQTAFRALHTSSPGLLARVPFQGRRMAQVAIHAQGMTGGITITATVYGVRYAGRSFAIADDSVSPMSIELDSWDVSTDVAGVATQFASDIKYVGGTDHAEFFDELELRVSFSSAGNATIVGAVEAWGEHGTGGV